jgi:serine/arginine repetitive matrix protein 2
VQNTSGLDTRPRALNNVSKASALLDSVVDSIQSPRNQTTSSSSNELITRGVSEIEYSSSDRRHKDLADAIFGSQDNDGQDSPVKESYPSMEVPSITVEPSPPNGTTRHPHGNGVSPAGVESSFYSSPRDLRGPRSARIQSPSSTQADLVREVQRKTEAAMAELRRNPETPSDQLRANGLTARKRISPSQISEPRLVSASTSVDTIPLRSPSMSSGHQNSTIGDKLRRLRGTLRVKQATIPNGDEVTPYPLTMQSPPPQLARADSRPNTISARDSTGFKAPVTSPPASAGPSIRGFLGRLRRPRTMNNPSELDRLDRRPTSNADSGAAFSPAASLPVSPMSPVYLRSAPPTTAVFNPALPERTAPAYSNSLDVDENPGNLTETEDRVARKRFLDAASTLGLDEDEVQDLLARRSSNRITATSPTSRHIPANSHARPISPPGNTDPPSTNARAPVAMNDAHERSRSRKPNAPTALDGDAARNDDTPVRKLSFRRRLDPQHEAQSDRAANAIVRRTIIFASESTPTIDLNSILRRSSQSKNRRRSSSGGSIRSSRSVHDRAPTPPPPRSPSSKRFSRDSPPVPKLPPSFAAQAENMLQQSLAVPAPSPIEKTSSTYDSLYVS